MTVRSVVVVGAGIGGLATATLLARDGWRVTVLEQAEDLAPVGAGILLQALGQQVAGLLGIADDLRARSTPVVRVDGRLVSGRETMQLDYARVAPGSQAWGVHRGVLFSLLHAACCRDRGGRPDRAGSGGRRTRADECRLAGGRCRRQRAR